MKRLAVAVGCTAATLSMACPPAGRREPSGSQPGDSERPAAVAAATSPVLEAGARRHPRLREGDVTSRGDMDKEVIQIAVRRQFFGLFRPCYEAGLLKDPNLSGRVTVQFVIDAKGAVTTADDDESELPDHDVVDCVVRAFRTLSFPAPHSGTVEVVYPIMFFPPGR